MQLVAHGCPSHQPFAHQWDSFWHRQDPPAQGTELQRVVTRDKLSFCPHRCCLLGTSSQVSPRSFPSPSGASPCPPRASPLCLWEGEQGSVGSVAFLQRSQQHPVALPTCLGQLETRQAKPFPASQLCSYPAYRQHSPWLNWEQGRLRAQCQEGWGLMLSPYPQCACSWRRAAWAGSTGGRTWPHCCSAWPPPCAGCCRASLRPAARGATWLSR